MLSVLLRVGLDKSQQNLVPNIYEYLYSDNNLCKNNYILVKSEINLPYFWVIRMNLNYILKMFVRKDRG